jgi:hypothetical protein
LLCSLFKAVNSGKINRRIASSTVSRSFGLLIDDFEVPDLNEYASPDFPLRWELRRLESAPETIDSS